MQWWFPTLSLNDPSNHRSKLIHSYFDTNITLFPYWIASPRGQLIVDNQSTYARFCNASYRTFPNTKSWWLLFWPTLFFPSFLDSSMTPWNINNTTQSHPNFNEWSLSLALDSQTWGLTYNIPNLILVNLSLDNVNHTWIITLGVAWASDPNKTYTHFALEFSINKSRGWPSLRNTNPIYRTKIQREWIFKSKGKAVVGNCWCWRWRWTP